MPGSSHTAEDVLHEPLPLHHKLSAHYLSSHAPNFKPMYFHILFFPGSESTVLGSQSFSDWWRKSPWNLVLLQACMLFAQHTPVIPPPLLSLTLHNSGKCGSAQTNPKGMCFQTKNIQKLGHHLDEDRLLNHLKETENHYAQQKTAQQNVWDFPLEFVLSQRAFCRRDCPRVKCLRNSQ